MELIYAFRDQEGNWYGDPDAEIQSAAPGEGTLTYRPRRGSEGAASPFAGQRLQVRYADVKQDPGPETYKLDDGRRYSPTWTVYELLADPHQTRPPHRQTVLRHSLDEAEHHYVVTIRPTTDDKLSIEILGNQRNGQRVASLTGLLLPGHLAALGRLLAKAARDTEGDRGRGLPKSSPPMPSRHGVPWTEGEKQRLVSAHQAGQSIPDLAKIHGRTPRAIRMMLTQLGRNLIPALPRPRTSPE